MSLQQNLTQFRFDLETLQLMLDSNRNDQEVRNELSSLGFTNNLVSLVLDNRRLLNSVMLRLQLYSESNLEESNVRENLNKLNNNQVSDLLNHLYSTVAESVEEVEETDNTLEESETENNIEVTDETVLLNNFFNECITQTNEATDVVRSSEFYNALTSWWSSDNVEVPDKKVLKNYLNERLGKANKSTWSCVALN